MMEITQKEGDSEATCTGQVILMHRQILRSKKKIPPKTTIPYKSLKLIGNTNTSHGAVMRQGVVRHQISILQKNHTTNLQSTITNKESKPVNGGYICISLA